MTETEAVEGAVERHEFRTYETVDTVLGEQYRAVCWCGDERGPYSTLAAGRHAHEEHQQRQLNLAAIHPGLYP